MDLIKILFSISIFFGLANIGLCQSQNSDIHLPRGKYYGQVVREPYPLALGGDNLLAVFVAGSLAENANKDNRQFVIEKLQNDDAYADNWELISDDITHDATLKWEKPYPLVDQSRVVVNWEVPTGLQNGVYRIRHLGYYSADNAILTPYVGKTHNFRIRGMP